MSPLSDKMRGKFSRRTILTVNTLNLLIAIHFVIVATVSLFILRWYHHLTVVVRVRYIYTSTTSYLAFIALILVSIILIILFIVSSIKFSGRVNISTDEDAVTSLPTDTNQQVDSTSPKINYGSNDGKRSSGEADVCLWTLAHSIASIGFIGVLMIWLLNYGEPIRQTISAELEQAFSRYQFTNRTNPYTLAIDGMQDMNDCCGSFDYTDFPHQRVSGLSSGNYPGSCCGKNIFGNNARVVCMPEEIVKVRQTVS